VVDDGLVVVEEDLIRYVGPAGASGGPEPLAAGAVDAVTGDFVLPGLVDLHNHGGGGAAMAAGSLRAAVEHHHRRGTTAVMASVMTDSPASMLEAVAEAADAADRGEVAAVHLEGPFLSAQYCGAQDPAWLRPPDPAGAARLLEAGRGHVRVMTVAPELPGADALVDLLLERGVVPAVGHSQADGEQVRRHLHRVRRALGRPGVVTHLFNGMPAFHHRSPGPAGGALGAAAQGDAVVELIADGVHLDDRTVRMIFDLLGPERIALVTDAMPAAGMPDGDYQLGGQRVRVAQGVARLARPDAPLAGGTAHLIDVVRRCVAAGVRVQDAVCAASVTPAGALGLAPRGLTQGSTADLVVTDADLRPLRVMRAGAWLS
jgi:N-acetylglucosamine-6-phosphate deacetylase